MVTKWFSNIVPINLDGTTVEPQLSRTSIIWYFFHRMRMRMHATWIFLAWPRKNGCTLCLMMPISVLNGKKTWNRDKLEQEDSSLQTNHRRLASRLLKPISYPDCFTYLGIKLKPLGQWCLDDRGSTVLVRNWYTHAHAWVWLTHENIWHSYESTQVQCHGMVCHALISFRYTASWHLLLHFYLVSFPDPTSREERVWWHWHWFLVLQAQQSCDKYIGLYALTWWSTRPRNRSNVTRPFPHERWGLGTRLTFIMPNMHHEWQQNVLAYITNMSCLDSCMHIPGGLQ